eukprot:CAMPEP_0113572100 /NCGR_PEP_ID=MMETSP0015_2-20120614/25913_1 /TAXON_ID=2838 /ORGANISM="Odontella" /LENGTH=102 /DNA_ID=CAMNT_0000475107 /DNA_START=205 /DNA_END=510 /DNA_ORIENTATION=- /assembly_acc=CAM_ASM_000160
MVQPPPAPVQRTALQLYRDLLRLIEHVAPGTSPKAIALRATVRAQFDANRSETDVGRVEAHKASAVRALSNYMLYESGAKDKKLGKAMSRFNDDALASGEGG